MSNPSPAANQSYSNYEYSSSNSSGGSTPTGGRGTSSGSAMLNQWNATRDRTENFYATGQKTGRGVIPAIDTIQEFDRRFQKSG
ncbi:hypothetical protein ACLX1H_006174 [Fusarium chlamydosporum]